MRPSMKLSLGWLMNDLIPAVRGRPGSTAVHIRYELAGLVLHEPPVPASADAVVVEVRLRLPPLARQKVDYCLRFPGLEPVAPEYLRKDESDPHRYRLMFRMAVPKDSVRGELLWRNKLIADVLIPVQSSDDFLAKLSASHATASVQIADRSVAAQTFVAAQCRGFTTALVLKSPTVLAPLSSLGVRVVFRSDRSTVEQVVPVPLSSSQLGAKDVLLTASPPRPPRRAGTYTATWFTGPRELAAIQVRAVSGREFLQSLRLSDTRFAVVDKTGSVRFVRHAPPPGADIERIGPCFVVCSHQPGMAGWISLKAVGQPIADPPQELDGSILVTDGPTVFAPGMLDIAATSQLTGFDLRTKTHTLGTMSLHPVPTAAFNAEGGYKPPPDFAWTPTAEDELAERLAKLMRDN